MKANTTLFSFFKLQPVEYLVGSTARLQDVIVLGMLTQLKEVRYLLHQQENTNYLPISLTLPNHFWICVIH